ncbi:MAG TPA: hypothetical protein VKE92_14915 [Anaerolineales bacterium]|nr:hypothetical protein [Anaerolineales bacterium]
MKVLLAFPFRDMDGSRAPLYHQTLRVVGQMYPWDAIIEVDSGHESFNRAATRNLAMEYGQINNFDIVVVNDADSVASEWAMSEAINGAHSDNLIHFPFDTFYELIPKATAQVGVQSIEILKQRAYGKGQSEGGIWVCKPEVWFKAGGQDERFAGWGCEDRAFLSATHTLVGKSVKHQGPLFCMYHDRSTNNAASWIPEEVDLLVQYNDAYQQPEKMREIIDGRSYYSVPFEATAEECGPTIRELPRDLYC